MEMFPIEGFGTWTHTILGLALMTFAMLWPRIRRAFVRHKVRKARGARRLSKLYRRRHLKRAS